MSRVYIYCEGHTEESFVSKILAPYFVNKGIFTYPIVCTTSRSSGKKFKGGVTRYEKVRHELINLCKQHPREHVTTMFDYYAMPKETPGMNCTEPDVQKRMEQIESKIDDDINQYNCKFHFMLHEFEGILFSDPDAFRIITSEATVQEIQLIRDQFLTPEHINNSYETAPSRRLMALIPGYSKTLDGIQVALNMEISVMLDQCPHFKKWINWISSLA